MHYSVHEMGSTERAGSWKNCVIGPGLRIVSAELAED